MKEWFELSEEDRKLIIQQTSSQTRLSPTAVEKDFWVMIALNAIFKTKYAPHLVFKGGTSLSKAWGLIQRFSEDIDLALDRDYLGFSGDLSKKKVTKLRKAACSLVSNELIYELEVSLNEMGVKGFEISCVEFERSDTDPVSVELKYTSITDRIEYLKPQVLIEISARSLRDPNEKRLMKSHISEVYPNAKFSDKEIEIPTVLPKRTFLEKIFLLHEEFQKPNDHEIKSYRMTRHLYDLGKIIDTSHAQEAIDDEELYKVIVRHRRILTNITWVDYGLHAPQTISYLPPVTVKGEWKNDYKAMSESMFQGETIPYEDLIAKLKNFNDKINSIMWSLH